MGKLAPALLGGDKKLAPMTVFGAVDWTSKNWPRTVNGKAKRKPMNA